MAMTKGERQELGQLIRKREKVMKMDARERSAVLLAEFDAATAKIYRPSDDPVWEQLKNEAEAAITKAQEGIAERCEQLGIHRDFAPGMSVGWYGRGHNAMLERRTELRRAAKSRIEAIEAEVVSKIERLSLTAQTEIVSHGLESDAAKDFLGRMPDLSSLMPRVEIEEIEALVTTQRSQRKQAWLN